MGLHVREGLINRVKVWGGLIIVEKIREGGNHEGRGSCESQGQRVFEFGGSGMWAGGRTKVCEIDKQTI